MGNFPNMTRSSPAFRPEFVNAQNYTDFFTKVYEFRDSVPLYPYSYGSFELFQANRENHQIQVNTFLNITSQDVTGIYPQYLYQALFKTQMNDPDFEFNLTTAPYPIFHVFKQRETSAKSFDYIFLLSIALSLIPSVVVYFILNERENQLKHQ